MKKSVDNQDKNNKENKENNSFFVLNKDDFTVTGETRTVAVDEESNYNFVNKFGTGIFWWTFSIGDDLTTNRGITIGSTKKKVFEKYAEEEIFDFIPYDDIVFHDTIHQHENDICDQNLADKMIDFDNICEVKKVISDECLGDFKNFRGGEKWVEYSFPDDDTRIIYVLRFYFDSDEKVVLIAFFNIDCNLKESNPQINYQIIYDIQYKILPARLFFAPKDTIRSLIEDTYGIIYTFYVKNMIACPYDKEDFVASNKIIFVDNDTFNLLTIKFEIPMSGVLSREIRIAYSNDFKNVRYFTIETDPLSEDVNEIHFCEVFKDGRENYGNMIYDENAIEKVIVDLYTEKVTTTGMVTKYPRPKAKTKEININDEVWMGIRVDFVKNWKNYEPDSKMESVEGMLIFGLEEGSPFKKCNLSFDTANFLVKFDGIKLTNIDEFSELLKKYKPKDKVIVTINTYDAEVDKFLSNEYKIELGSKNEENYVFVLDLESITPKMALYYKCLEQEKKI